MVPKLLCLLVLSCLFVDAVLSTTSVFNTTSGVTAAHSTNGRTNGTTTGLTGTHQSGSGTTPEGKNDAAVYTGSASILIASVMAMLYSFWT